MTPPIPPWNDPPIFEWDEKNEDHIWSKHQVSVFEVEECFGNPHDVVPHRDAQIDPRCANRYVIHGYTDADRKLIVIVEYKGGDVIRPITSWEL